MTYVAEESAQKLTNASSDCPIAVKFNKFPENSSGKKTKKFLYHCCGLNNFRYFILLFSSERYKSFVAYFLCICSNRFISMLETFMTSCFMPSKSLACSSLPMHILSWPSMLGAACNTSCIPILFFPPF